MGEPRLPDFIIVGAQKAGTTSLHVWLSSLEGVTMPRDKEVSFFCLEERYRKGLEWYKRKFSHAEMGDIVGESSPDYLFHDSAASRIHEHVPGVKLIFVFREPIERAFSHYLMSARKGLETLSFQEALMNEEKRNQLDPESRSFLGYMARGAYSNQLQRYRDLFREEDLLYVKFEDLTAGGVQTENELKRICEFIGVVPKSFKFTKENTASRPRIQWLRKFLYSPNRIKLLSRLFIPSYEIRSRIAHKIDTLNLSPIDKPEIEWVPEKVVEQTIVEIDNFEKMSGLDLSEWKDKVSKYQTKDTWR